MWTNTSLVTNVAMASSNRCVPAIGCVICVAETSASSRFAWMLSLSVVHAPAGSSSTEGPRANRGPPAASKNSGTQSTRWRTTSRATHPSHGAGLSQAAAGTLCTRAVNVPAMRR